MATWLSERIEGNTRQDKHTNESVKASLELQKWAESKQNCDYAALRLTLAYAIKNHSATLAQLKQYYIAQGG